MCLEVCSAFWNRPSWILFHSLNKCYWFSLQVVCLSFSRAELCMLFMFENPVSSFTVILLLSCSTSQCTWPKGIDDVCFMFVTVTGWTEYLQFMLHTSHWILKVVQLEREVQQWQESWLHKSQSAHGWPWPGCHTGWARGRWVDPAAVDSWGRRGATQRPRTGTRSCTRKISSTR